jgi:hypothetical protein
MTLKETEWARGTHCLSSIVVGQVRTLEEPEQVKHTHSVKCRGRSQDTKRNQTSERHSRTVNHGGRDKSGTSKETERVRVTHGLSTTEEGTSQDIERNRESEGHSHTVRCRARDKSGH